jgi:site-specific DNA recombinase
MWFGMRYEHVFGYLRLSQDDEEKRDESNSIMNQRLLIRQFIEKSGEFCGSEVHFMADDGYSGTNYNRPAFQNMIGMVKRYGSCCIIVKDLSRLGRDTIDTQNYIEKVFPFLGIRFIAINDDYDSEDTVISRKDTETKFRNLINGIYPQICSQNIKQALKKRDETGKYKGSVPPFGYQFDGTDKSSLIIDKETAEIVRYIFDNRHEGRGYTEIARILNDKGIITPSAYLKKKGENYADSGVQLLWTRRMVKKILTNPVYTGAVVNHKTENKIISVKSPVDLPREEWICVPGMHEAIIEPDELVVVSPVRKNHSCNCKKTSRNIFAWKLKCGHCRRAMRVRAEKYRKNSIFLCCTPKHYSGANCYRKPYLLADLEKLVLTLVKKQAALAEDTLERVKQLNDSLDIPLLKRKKEDIERKIKRNGLDKIGLYEQYAAGELPREVFVKEKERISLENAGYKEQMSLLDRKIDEAEKEKEQENSVALQTFSKYVELEELTYPIVQELIEAIYFYDPEHIEVIWKYRDEYMAVVDGINEMDSHLD